jgi:hypothetical protein
MGKIFLGGSVVGLALIGLVLFTLWTSRAFQPSPDVLGIANEFEGNLQLPEQTIRPHFEHARERMLRVNTDGTRWQLVGNFAGWFAFLITSSVTLIMGYFGVRYTNNPPNIPPASLPATNGLPARVARAVGLLAALAAVVTGIVNIANAQAQQSYRKSDDIRAAINTDRVKLLNAKTREEAEAVLDELDTLSQR